MSEARLRELEAAILKADAEGDVEAAKLFAAEHSRTRESLAAASSGAGAGVPTTRAGGEAQAQATAQKGLEKAFSLEGVKTVGRKLGGVAGEAAKSVASVAMLPGELIRSAANKLGGDPADFGRGTEIVRGAIDSVLPPPQAGVDKKTTELIGGTAAGLAFPGSKIRNLIAGAGSTAGGMVGQEMAGENGSIIPGMIGSVAGGLPAMATSGKAKASQMLAESLKGVTPGQMAAARKLAEEAKAAGVVLTPEQLFDGATGLTDLVNRTIRSGVGSGQLQRDVIGQRDLMEEFASRAGNRLGASVDTDVAVRDLRQATEGAIGDLKLTPAQRKLFDGDGALIGGPEIDRLARRLGELAREAKATPETAAQIDGIRKLAESLLQTTKVNLGRPNMEPGAPGYDKVRERLARRNSVDVVQGVSPSQLDEVVQEAQARLADLSISSPGVARRQTARVGEALNEVKAVLDQAIATRPEARDLYKALMRQREGMTSDLVGRIAGRSGVNEALPDNRNLIRSTLGANVRQPQAVERLAGALRDRGRSADQATAAQANRALPQAVRSLWDDALDNAFTPNASGQVPANAGAVFSQQLLGGSRGKNFDAMTRNVAVQFGADPQDFAQGMRTALKLLEASGRNRSSVPVPAADMTSRSVARDAYRLTQPLAQSEAISQRLLDVTRMRQYRELSKIFTSPDAIRIIEEIGRTPIVSNRQGALMTTLFNTLSQSGETRQEEPQNGP